VQKLLKKLLLHVVVIMAVEMLRYISVLGEDLVVVEPHISP
jgi:hypothetical protein